jgi:hypothetical protein
MQWRINGIIFKNMEEVQFIEPRIERELLCVGYKGYLKVTRIIHYLPYPFRWIFWSLLYRYNKYRFPNGTFTIKEYQSYAK